MSNPAPQGILPDSGRNVIVYCDRFRCWGFHCLDGQWRSAVDGAIILGVRAWADPSEHGAAGWHPLPPDDFVAAPTALPLPMRKLETRARGEASADSDRMRRPARNASHSDAFQNFGIL